VVEEALSVSPELLSFVFKLLHDLLSVSLTFILYL
jgi:hypothetical protein